MKEKDEKKYPYPGTPYVEKMDKLMFKDHYKITLRVLATTVLTLSVLGGGGYYLDQLLGKAPLFMVVGLLLSFPLAQLIIYRMFKKITQK